MIEKDEDIEGNEEDLSGFGSGRKNEGNSTAVDDEHQKYTLESTLNHHDLSINFSLKCFDMEEGTMSTFSLLYTQEMMSDEMRYIFGDVANLFEICFRCEKNYWVEGNGKIKIYFRAVFKGKELKKELYIHLLAEECKEEKRNFQEVLRKIKRWKQMEKSKELSAMKAEMKNKMRRVSHNLIFPHKNNKNLMSFLVRDNIIERGNSSSSYTTYSSRRDEENKNGQWKMLALDTEFLDENQFIFKVKVKSRLENLIVGLVSEKCLPVVTTHEKAFETLYYKMANRRRNEYGSRPEFHHQVSYLGKQEKKMIFEDIDEVEFSVSKKEGKVKITLLHENNWIAESLQLRELKDKKIYPYIELCNEREKLMVSLEDQSKFNIFAGENIFRN